MAMAHTWASGGQKQERGQWEGGWEEKYKLAKHYVLNPDEKTSRMKLCSPAALEINS